jgi:S1-C subfamily serine protease
MPNDTPDDASHDSHAPFISERNEAGDVGVPNGMDTTKDGYQMPDDGHHIEEDESSPLAADSQQVEETDSGESIIHDAQSDEEIDQPEEAAFESDSESGEPTTDNDSFVESDDTVAPVPTVAFDYDDYYGVPEAPQSAVIAPTSTSQPATSSPKRSSVPFFLGALAAGVVGAAMTLGVLAGTGTFEETETPTTTVVNAAEAAETIPIPAVTTQIINDLGSAINPTAVAAKVVPSIVTVTVFDGGDDNEEGLFGVGSGSGVVVSRDGYIITNHHVIDGASDYRVEFEDGRVYTAELIGSDDLTDIAVLQISADNLVPIDVGSSDDLDLGDPAIAVGNPLGQIGGASVSVGIVSAFDRRVDFSADDFLHGMIQTDAAINSGSSGGALVNADGALIGITSAIGVSQAGPEGIGYAIPVELVKRISDEIIEDGDVQHPFLGVTIGTYFDEAADGATVPAGSDIQTIEGTDSAAGQGGLLPGDIIVRIGDKPIADQTDLILAVRLYRVGDEVEFGVIRDGEHETFVVKLGQRPQEFGG